MSKTINAVPCTITFSNIFTSDVIPVKDLGLTGLNTIAEDDIFNTGLSMVGDPHADEDAEDAGKVILKDEEAWVAKHIASIRLYKSNSYVYLEPGDTFTLKTGTSEETAYYLGIESGLLKVEVAEADDEEASESNA